jgi:hypothetical protein
MPSVINVPKSLVYMISSYNDKLQNLQKEFLNDIQEANAEVMQMLNLNPEDGWRLDLETFTYILPDTPDTPEITSTET